MWSWYYLLFMTMAWGVTPHAQNTGTSPMTHTGNNTTDSNNNTDHSNNGNLYTHHRAHSQRLHSPDDQYSLFRWLEDRRCGWVFHGRVDSVMWSPRPWWHPSSSWVAWTPLYCLWTVRRTYMVYLYWTCKSICINGNYLISQVESIYQVKFLHGYIATLIDVSDAESSTHHGFFKWKAAANHKGYQVITP